MRLSRRETYIGAVALAAVALLVADHYAISPLLERGRELESERQQLARSFQDAEALFARRRLMDRKWQQMTTGGLSAEPGRAESLLLHALRDWAQQTGLALVSLKPERSEHEKGLSEVTVLASGTGRMSAVGQFLWLVETAELPLRLGDLQLGARREGTDDLSLQLRLSTIYLSGESSAMASAEGVAP